MSEVVVISPERLAQVVREAVETAVGSALSALSRKNAGEMSEREAAAYLGLAAQTLRGWRVQKRGPKYHKHGRSVRYARADLDTWLKGSEVETIDSLERGHEKLR